MAITEVQGTPNRPGRRGYVTTTFTGKDIRKARGLLDKQAKASADKIRAEKSTWNRKVRNFRDQVKIVSDKSAEQIAALQRSMPSVYPKGALGSGTTRVMMGAYIKNGRVVHEGDPDY